MGYDGDMHGPSTRVMETGLKYYIDAIGRSSGGVQLMVSGRQRRHSSSNYRAAADAACKEKKEPSGRIGRTTGRQRQEHRHRNRTFSVLKLEHRTSAIIPESAEL